MKSPKFIKKTLTKLLKASKKQFTDENGNPITVEEYVDLVLNEAKENPAEWDKFQQENQSKKNGGFRK